MIAGKLYGDTTADDRHQEPFQSVEAAICQDGFADRMSLMGRCCRKRRLKFACEY